MLLPTSSHSNDEIYIQNFALNISRGKFPITTKGEMQKDKQWCDHCNKPYHTKETCWKIDGKPPRNQQKGGQSTYMVEAEKGNSTIVSLTTD